MSLSMFVIVSFSILKASSSWLTSSSTLLLHALGGIWHLIYEASPWVWGSVEDEDVWSRELRWYGLTRYYMSRVVGEWGDLNSCESESVKVGFQVNLSMMHQICTARQKYLEAIPYYLKSEDRYWMNFFVQRHSYWNWHFMTLWSQMNCFVQRHC